MCLCISLGSERKIEIQGKAEPVCKCTAEVFLKKGGEENCLYQDHLGCLLKFSYSKPWRMDISSYSNSNPQRSYSKLCLNVVELGFDPNSVLI